MAWVGAPWAAAAAAAAPPVRNGIMPGTAAAAEAVSCRRRASAASARAVALAGRSCGSLASMDMISARTGSGMVSGRGGGGSLTWASAMAIWDSPEKGRCPTRHS